MSTAEEVLIISAVRSILINDATVITTIPATRILAATASVADDETFLIPMITIDCELGDSDPQLDASVASVGVLIWSKRDTVTVGGSKQTLYNYAKVIDDILNKQLDNLSSYDSSLDIHKFRRVTRRVDYIDDLDCWLVIIEYDLVLAES